MAELDGQQGDAFADALHLFEQQEEPPEQQHETNPGMMTADQVNDMLRNQREMMEEQSRSMVEAMRESFRPQQPQEEQQQQGVSFPDQQEMVEALNAGDTQKYLNLQNQQTLALHQMYENRIRGLESQGMQRLTELNEQVIKQQNPQYAEYEEDIKKMMDQAQVPADQRTNPVIIDILTKAAIGANLEKEFEKKIEATRRQRNLSPTGEPSPKRYASGGAGGGRGEPVFSDESLQALRQSRRTPDDHARSMGYQNWAEYEKATQEKYDKWNEHEPSWRKKMVGSRTGVRGR